MSGDDDRSRTMVVDDGEEEQRLLARIDAEIAATLQVTPSVSFLPRARQRVAESRGSRWRWWLAPAAAAVVVGVLALLRPRPAPVTTASAPPRVAVEPAPPAAGGLSTVLPVTVTPAPVRRALGRPRGVPEVLVPRGEREALQRYLEDLRSQTAALAAPRVLGLLASGGTIPEVSSAGLALLPTQAAVTPIDPAPPPDEIEIRPIRITLIGVQPLTMESWNEE